ncbi:hypothetical protein B9P82_27635 [Citrobacter sp. L55]|nr:hypothetical protein B9P82_27635 [Citrobacter sp. L55]
MGSCAAPSAKGDDKFITTDYLQQCPVSYTRPKGRVLWRTGLQETVMSGSVGAQRKSFIARPDNPK